VLLFDEVEKAHPGVFNILLQILEDGIITDSQGRRIDCRNTVIILTSNVGARIISEKKGGLGFADSTNEDDLTSDDVKIKSDVMSELKRTFRPEFLNRIDDIIVFRKLTKNDIEQIARRMLDALSKRTLAIGITLKYTNEAVGALAKAGYDTVYGARPLRRAIVSNVEDKLSEQMLSGNAKAGDVLTLLYNEEDKYIFSKENDKILNNN
jgi:ATP-dependent Clp protease ATP-binding subunit ClpC